MESPDRSTEERIRKFEVALADYALRYGLTDLAQEAFKEGSRYSAAQRRINFDD
ncbi:hypothetical protein [Mameliella alba]|uniref:Uncharacterized protein n=1 Tax=Mameliella alba TaxID=561184 RepID=A0A0B3S0N0_9RHOB|nr:hypothetical protein [Mameliella alba]KHQ50141.1 hypothetical protein OA50_05260 [Mameliella alba]